MTHGKNSLNVGFVYLRGKKKNFSNDVGLKAAVNARNKKQKNERNTDTSYQWHHLRVCSSRKAVSINS